MVNGMERKKFKVPKQVSILGTTYRIEVHKKSDDMVLKMRQMKGYCNMGAKLIVIIDTHDEPITNVVDPDSWTKLILRHEITHAFLNESGLSYNTLTCDEPWAKNEEMVDWIAIQAPKLYKIWDKLGLVD